MKQMNKVRDMTKAKYVRFIHGTEDQIRRLGLLYPDSIDLTNGIKYEYTYEVYWDELEEEYCELINGISDKVLGVFRLTTSDFNEIKKNIGLKDMKTKNKRDWEII